VSCVIVISASSDELNHLDPVARMQLGGGVGVSGDHLSVELYRDSLVWCPQLL
jgi:hypothetical protein